MEIDCLIPAAGFSSRMGKWKLMLPYKTSTIIENSIKNALSLCSRVVIVAGYRAEELIERVKSPPQIETCINKNFNRGMFSSIQEGVKLIETDWFFITMGDMPDIGTDIYRSLIEARENNSNKFDIIRPTYHGKRGHPVLLHRKTIKTILKEPSTSEMKNIFSHFKVLDIEMDISQTFRDIDTPEEYKSILETQ